MLSNIKNIIYSFIKKLLNPLKNLLIFVLCAIYITIDYYLKDSSKSKKRRHRLTQIERRKQKESLNLKLDNQPVIIIDAYFTNFMKAQVLYYIFIVRVKPHLQNKCH